MFRAYTVSTEDPLCPMLVVEQIDALGERIKGIWMELRSSGPSEDKISIGFHGTREWDGYPTDRYANMDDECWEAFNKLLTWVIAGSGSGFHLSAVDLPEPEKSLAAAVRAKIGDVRTKRISPMFREHKYLALRDPELREEFERRVMVAVMKDGFSL